MWPFAKNLDDLTEEDLKGLIANSVRESVNLEFKREMYPRKDPAEKVEMLRDICSMANADGGAFIFGMEEDGVGQATMLRPVPEAEAEAKRIIDTCIANVMDRIPGLRTALVGLAAGGEVLVVQIPRSYRRPHMIVVDDSTEFWIRHDRRKASMSIAEVRSAILTVEDATMKVEAFVRNRQEALGRHTATYQLTLTATPLVLEDGRIDTGLRAIRDLLQNPPAFRPGRGVELRPGSSSPVPSLAGARIESIGRTKWLEVYRSGHAEFLASGNDLVYQRMPSSPILIKGWAIAEYVRNFVHFVSKLRRITQMSDPFVFGLGLWRIGEVGMYRLRQDDFGGLFGDEPRKYSEGDLILPPAVGAPDELPDQVARRILDLVWNAYGYESCPFFGSKGEFLIPEG